MTKLNYSASAVWEFRTHPVSPYERLLFTRTHGIKLYCHESDIAVLPRYLDLGKVSCKLLHQYRNKELAWHHHWDSLRAMCCQGDPTSPYSVSWGETFPIRSNKLKEFRRTLENYGRASGLQFSFAGYRPNYSSLPPAEP